MLRRFEVKNFKNFNDWFILDLSDVKSYEFNPECIENDMVSKALIYGPNGCGKTNLGRAIFDIRTHLTDHKTNENALRNYLSNYLHAGSNSDLAEFKFVFQFGNDILEYAYGKKSVDELVYETVTINDKDVISLDRRVNNIAMVDLPGAENLNRDLGDSDICVVKYVKNNTVLTDSSLKNVFELFFLFVQLMILEQPINSHNEITINASIVSKFILKDKKRLLDFEKFINEAGVKCKLTTMDKGGEEILAFDFSGEKIDFYSTASTGTLSLTEHYINVVFLQHNIQICSVMPSIHPFIFIDEFDAFYHHAVSKLIVKKLRGLKCQAILTTHNTSVMSNDLLRPDCYFFMSETEIKPMHRFTDKDLRKAHNIEKFYRTGGCNG